MKQNNKNQKLNSMKKTIYYLAIFALLTACTDRNQKNGNNETQMADTTASETNME